MDFLPDGLKLYFQLLNLAFKCVVLFFSRSDNTIVGDVVLESRGRSGDDVQAEILRGCNSV